MNPLLAKEAPAEEAAAMTEPSHSLGDLPLRAEGIVISVRGPRDLRRRLLEMGFCNRTRVQLIRRAPLGDPIEFRLRGYYVSLRKGEASFVRVLPVEDESAAGGENG